MNSLPRIAVVTPSYNTASYIGAAIRSVLDQDYPNLDYLVMDGGSTDQTLDILRSFGERIRWVSQKDDGQADAIRRGFEQTTGDILAWLNSDDMYCPGALAAVAGFFASHPDIDVVYGDANYVDADGSHIARCVHVEPYSHHRLVHYSDFIVQPAAFFRRRAYEAVGGIDPRLHWALDYDLWLKLAPEHRFAYLPRLLAGYRWLGSNKSATGGWERLDEIGAVFARRGLTSPAYIRLERANLHLREAISSLGRLKWTSALRSLASAAANTLCHPRAMLSLASVHTWRVIWVGQVLRQRSVLICSPVESA